MFVKVTNKNKPGKTYKRRKTNKVSAFNVVQINCLENESQGSYEYVSK